VRADPDFLQSILRNFLSNARRYTESGGILIGARRRGGNVCIEVWDSGPGMSRETQALIFEEFQRFQDVDNLGIRGAGLGLSVAKRMAELMQAKLDVNIITPKSQKRRADKLTGLTVLCVDDEVSILEGMRALLSRWDCDVLTCTNGEDAIELVCTHDVTAIIADFQLGKHENGLQVIAHLRPHLVAPDNVCLLTARKTKDIERYAANDNIRILNKPASPEDIKNFLLSCVSTEAAE